MSAPPAMVEVCTEFDSTDPTVCTASTWMPYSGGALPTLSIEDAQQIGLAFALLWATAYCIKLLKKVLTQVG